MPGEWFRVPATDGFEDRPVLPDGVRVDYWAGNRLGSSPQVVVWIEADQSVLDTLATTPGVTELPEAMAVATLRADSPASDVATADSFKPNSD